MGMEIRVRRIEVRGAEFAARRQEIGDRMKLRGMLTHLYSPTETKLRRYLREETKATDAEKGRLKKKDVGVYYHVDVNGNTGVIKGRLSDLPTSILRHVLVPEQLDPVSISSHVRREDLKIAERIIREGMLQPKTSARDIMAGFQPEPLLKIDWAKLPFDLNVFPGMAMFFARLKARDDAGHIVHGWEAKLAPKVGPSDHIYPFGTFPISPSAVALNYGQEGFEGMKAFRTVNGRLVGFRWIENVHRLQRTAKRLAMTPASDAFLLRAIGATVLANHEFVPPPGQRAALYVRPVQFGIGPELGVKPARTEAIVVYVSPVGPYFKSGFRPINLGTSTDYHRAMQGGVGDVKAGGSYAAGIMAQTMIKDSGLSEILWLDVSNQYVEEAGTANFFAVKDGVLYTPGLFGTILPGITRDSVIQLARAFGLRVVEEKLPIDFAMQADEAFCTGTAAVLCPVGSITHKDRKATFNNGEPGSITLKLYGALTAIQEGRLDDPSLEGINPEKLEEFAREWLYEIKEAA